MKTNTEKHIESSILKQTALIILTVFLLFVLGIRTAKSQSLSASVIAEENVMGFQSGAEVTLESKNQFGIGVFHQSSEIASFESKGNNYPFSGITMQAPLTKCGPIRLLGRVKAGWVNNQFLIVVPQLETQLILTKFLNLGLNMGYRAGYAAIGSRLTLSI